MEFKNNILTGQQFNLLAEKYKFETRLDTKTEYSIQEIVSQLLASNDNPNSINELVVNYNQNLAIYRPVPGNKNDFFVWPKSSSNLSSDLFYCKNIDIITKESKIVSMGSCFAVEIAKWLQKNNYNYYVSEPNLIEDENVHASSAKWGTIFNSAGFHQVVKWAFGEGTPPIVTYRSGNKYRDAFREDVLYDDGEIENLKEIWDHHLKCSRDALLSADVLILTVGLNEVFEYIPTGDYLHRNPWGLNLAVWKKKVLTIDENIELLSSGLKLLRQHNPKVKLIVSVSPVPLMRSFRDDRHVSVATSHSKAILRSTLDIFAEMHNDVYYMPSFETVMYPGESISAWEPDGRHVNRAIVQKIMNLFQAMFCGKDGLIESSWWFPGSENIAITNIYFEEEREAINKALLECINKELITTETAIELIHSIALPLMTNQYSREGYLNLRKIAYLSGFEFTNIARQFFKDKYAINNNHKSSKAVQTLEGDGYLVFEPTTSSMDFSKTMLSELKTKVVTREIDGQTGLIDQLIEEDLPNSFRYQHREEDLPLGIALDLLQKEGILEIIKEYLGSPIVRNVQAWHSVAREQSNELGQNTAAQMFHHDNDKQLGWIKVFIYLSDVGPENGPHAYVPGSHKDVPLQFRRDGRFKDEEVESHYREIRVLPGAAGTIVVGDTQCLHKGLEPKIGMRSIFQIEFCNALIGEEDPKISNPRHYLVDLGKHGIKFALRFLNDHMKSAI